MSSITRTLITMAPPYVLYTYAPTPNAIKATGTPDSPIVIMANNVAFSPNIPKNYVNTGFEDFVAYLSAYPLHYAFVYVHDSFLPQHVFEFHFTTTFTDAEVIVGILNDGYHMISMTIMDVRRALRLPIHDKNFHLPSIDECRAILVWSTLILQHFGTGYDDDQAEDWIHSFTSSKLFNQDPDDERRITKGMQKWINAPREYEKLAYVAPTVLSEYELMGNEIHLVSNQETSEHTKT
ncbi:unnamed protein product [Lactuca virosa]|uniref:Uncharacterized protein n=1 Tax=Lactuca virosa TaxID=75947 RepID=A0AAU9LLT3_9ASTR|nr:unnamed protein product [Lactuca virosa]